MLYLEVKLLQANYDLCIYQLKCHKISTNEMFKENEGRKNIPLSCVCVFTSIHLEGFICLGLEVQGTDQRCCVEDVIFLCQVPSTILQYESPSLSN